MSCHSSTPNLWEVHTIEFIKLKLHISYYYYFFFPFLFGLRLEKMQKIDKIVGGMIGKSPDKWDQKFSFWFKKRFVAYCMCKNESDVRLRVKIKLETLSRNNKILIGLLSICHCSMHILFIFYFETTIKFIHKKILLK